MLLEKSLNFGGPPVEKHCSKAIIFYESAREPRGGPSHEKTINFFNMEYPKMSQKWFFIVKTQMPYQTVRCCLKNVTRCLGGLKWRLVGPPNLKKRTFTQWGGGALPSGASCHMFRYETNIVVVWQFGLFNGTFAHSRGQNTFCSNKPEICPVPECSVLEKSLLNLM